MKKVFHNLTKVFSNIVIILLVFVLAFAVYNFVNVKLLKKDYSNLFGYTYFDIVTGSMVDAIHIDDYVFVKLTKNVSENDVISFKSNGIVVTHRIIKIDNDKIITKGDANNVIDKAITIDNVIGKVVYIGKGYGTILKTLSTPIVFITLFATILLFSYYFSLNKE